MLRFLLRLQWIIDVDFLKRWLCTRRAHSSIYSYKTTTSTLPLALFPAHYNKHVPPLSPRPLRRRPIPRAPNPYNPRPPPRFPIRRSLWRAPLSPPFTLPPVLPLQNRCYVDLESNTQPKCSIIDPAETGDLVHLISTASSAFLEIDAPPLERYRRPNRFRSGSGDATDDDAGKGGD